MADNKIYRHVAVCMTPKCGKTIRANLFHTIRSMMGRHRNHDHKKPVPIEFELATRDFHGRVARKVVRA